MKRFEWILAALPLVGCSSTSSPAPGNLPDTGVGSSSGATGGSSGAGAASCTGSPVVWEDDGTTHCASSGEAIFGSDTILNPLDGGPETMLTLELVATQDNTSYGFTFIVDTSAPTINGTYSCTPVGASVAELTYNEIGVFSTSVVSFSITVTVTPTDGGHAVATGTFSAQLAVTDGGTKTLSNGTFDLPVTYESQ